MSALTLTLFFVSFIFGGRPRPFGPSLADFAVLAGWGGGIPSPLLEGEGEREGEVSVATAPSPTAVAGDSDRDAVAGRSAPAASLAEAPISLRDLHARVSPAVVALVVSGGAAMPPTIVSGVLVTASGLVLTSRRAISEVIDGHATVNLVRRSGRGRAAATARDLAEAVPARLRAVSDELDLALLEAMPAETVFYPHLPIVRHRAADGSATVAVGHAKKRGMWSGTMIPLGPAVGSAGAERWLRQLPVETALVGAGAPLVDGVGRIVALATEPSSTATGDSRMAVDAEGLLRFLLAANAPELRFAGVPPSRRAGPAELAVRAAAAAAATAARHPSAQSAPAGKGVATSGGVGAPAANRELEMPGVVRKGVLDRRFSPTPTSTTRMSTAASAGALVEGNTDAREAVSMTLAITLANLERHAPPTTLLVETGDAPERGARDAPVTIVELGDYHAPETREAEPALHALTDGAAAPARLLWKDADRGDGADYDLPARAARAAAEQDGFWSMHDRLLRQPAPQPLDIKRVGKLARELELDGQQFATSLSSEGLASSIETDAMRAGRLPLLCTPAFVVNGEAVDGGSMAVAALCAAVDDQLMRAARQPGAATAGRTTRAISAGAPIVGAPYDADRMARVIADVTAHRASDAARASSP
ncbi:MAG: trypsin-like peptidase domain-containing protein [Myxococcales bacterium]